MEEEEIEGAGGEPTLAPSPPPSCDTGPEVHELLSQRQEAGERQSRFPCVLPAQAPFPPGRPRPHPGRPRDPGGLMCGLLLLALDKLILFLKGQKQLHP